MAIEFGIIKGKNQVTAHYANSSVPNLLDQNFDGFDPDLVGVILHDQETLYQSLMENGESSRGSTIMRHADIDAQLAHDEAFARRLQEMEDSLANSSLDDNAESDDEGCVDSPSDSEADDEREAVRENNVDPDNMTYEELRSLGEEVGSESRGLSDELISYLDSSTYKSNFFSRKGNEECVICKSAYRNRDKLITLPCKHNYHANCIRTWLKIEKTCPVCKYEVFGPS